MAAASAWASLDGVLVDRLLARLPCLAHRAVFGAVCKNWRGVALLNPPGPQLPWLLFPSASAAEQEPCFFCLLCRTTHRAALPGDVRAARWCGSSRGGWLVLALHQASGYVLHSLHTGQRIPLPEILRTPVPVDDHGMVIHAARAARAVPPEDGAYFAAAVAGFASPIAFWRIGTDHWAAPTPEDPHARDSWAGMLPGASIADVLPYSGHGLDGFYVLTDDEGLLVYIPGHAPDGALTTRLVTYRFPLHEVTEPAPGCAITRYLVRHGDDLLMVARHVSPDDWTLAFRVVKLDPWAAQADEHGERQASWAQVPVITTGVVFLGRCCSRSYPTYGIDFDGVYFLDDVTSSQDAVTRALEPATMRLYPCGDMGWLPLLSHEIQMIFPARLPSESSRAVWFFQ